MCVKTSVFVEPPVASGGTFVLVFDKKKPTNFVGFVSFDM